MSIQLLSSFPTGIISEMSIGLMRDHGMAEPPPLCTKQVISSREQRSLRLKRLE